MKNKTNFGTSNTEMVTISRAEYEKLQADHAYVSELEQQMRWLMEQMKLLKRKQFGSSSEKASDEVMEQLSLLFDEAEAYAHTEQKAETTVKEHTRKKNSGSIQDVVPKDIPVEEIIHELPEDQRLCPQFGKEMVVVGKEVHESLKIKPAEAILQWDIYYTYACASSRTPYLSFSAKPETHSFRRSSFPNRTRYAGLRFGVLGGGGASGNTEIRHGLPAVPSGAGVEPQGPDALPADHVQLAAAVREGLA